MAMNKEEFHNVVLNILFDHVWMDGDCLGGTWIAGRTDAADRIANLYVAQLEETK